MKELTIKNLIADCKGILLTGNEKTILDNFSFDTRTLKPNDIFIGIKGATFDGGSLYEEALKKGAKGCIINENIEVKEENISKYSDNFIVKVKDTLECLQKLAQIKRDMYDIPVVAITGSVGKTSTKDLVASVLSQKFKVLKTEGNFNNQLGLPLTILKLKDENCLVVEMGMNSLGEISHLSQIAKPTLGVITNIGTAHIGLLGSRENILKAKLEILDGMSEKNLIINLDNDLLDKWYQENNSKMNIITYGINNKKSNYRATNIKEEALFSEYEVNNKLIRVNTPGEHFVLNSLAALTVGLYYNISMDDIAKGVLNYELSKRRMEIENYKGITIINDSYNANYDSMKSAIEYLGSLKTRKIAVLGDMLELGDFSEKLHRDLGKVILDNKIDILITVGTYAKYISDECLSLGFNKDNIYSYDNNKDAINKLKELIKKEDNILLKASNGMHFIEIYNALKED